MNDALGTKINKVKIAFFFFELQIALIALVQEWIILYSLLDYLLFGNTHHTTGWNSSQNNWPYTYWQKSIHLHSFGRLKYHFQFQWQREDTGIWPEMIQREFKGNYNLDLSQAHFIHKPATFIRRLRQGWVHTRKTVVLSSIVRNILVLLLELLLHWWSAVIMGGKPIMISTKWN